MPPVPVPPTTLLAVDGNSLGHRAWHAIRGSDDEVGEFVAAGVLGLIASVWHHGPYDALLVAFDHADNRRRQQHPTYKAGRDTDPDLQVRLRQLAHRLSEFGVATVDEAGLEADDLLAAASQAATARGWRTDVLSGDRDMTALVDEQVRLLRPRGTMSDLVVTTPDVVVASYGVGADQYHDYAALRGDPSDGLPGVNGVGPKTAALLLADHGTIEELYANLCFLPTKVERALRDGRDVAFHNRRIMEPIAPDLPIDLALDTAATFNLDAVVVILEDLGADDAGLTRAARRLARAAELAAMPRPDLTTVPPPDAPLPEDVEPRVLEERDDEESASMEATTGDDVDPGSDLLDDDTDERSPDPVPLVAATPPPDDASQPELF
ncbi:MAG TPA: 5'-3' exonuclease H3TH domain-containing protein [Nitriliruptoraceae bacterium]|nr:5'-3' exonuclease H3TH domain-containing protein [Nitriliruptoraceae bacterium]